ncbi:MAG: acetylornithine/succinylornithine family transaminase [Planctomycetota bacterium]|nr:acetylornithine/succinylornithine family transaminase [Planctomycetota bacterium]
MSMQTELIETTKKVLMPNYGPPLRAMVRGSGAKIWDADGGQYIDFFAGFGGGGVAGHCHPAVVEAIGKQAGTLLSHGNFFTNPPQVELAEAITKHAFAGKAFFCHSGAEANEAAIKLVRLAAGDERYKIISFHNCFHGRTMGSLSLTPAAKQTGFEPMLPGNVKVDYGDLDAVAEAVDDETAGIFVEPVQGEGGVNVPTAEFMQGLRALCDEKNILLVVDEVWTAPARTGRWFAYQHFGVVPDVMTLAKAIGGGVPVGVCLASPKYADVLAAGTHGCTMGGNPLCAAAGVACMKLIEQHDLVARAAGLGRQVTQAIAAAGIGCVKEVRGLGLMIGVELDKSARDVFLKAMDSGLLVCYAGRSVLRLAPPLVIEDDVLAKGMDILIDVLKK